MLVTSSAGQDPAPLPLASTQMHALATILPHCLQTWAGHDRLLALQRCQHATSRMQQLGDIELPISAKTATLGKRALGALEMSSKGCLPIT